VEELQLKIAESEYDHKVAGHFGHKKAQELNTLNVHRPKMEQ
jgi:hypothetical protein